MPPLLRSNALSHVQPPLEVANRCDRHDRPGWSPSTHALNASTHHGSGLQGIPLPSAPSTPSQAGPVLPSKTVPQVDLARAEGRERRARASASSSFPRLPLEVPATYTQASPLLTASKVSTAGTPRIGCVEAPRVSEPGVGHLGSSSHQSGA